MGETRSVMCWAPSVADEHRNC